MRKKYPTHVDHCTKCIYHKVKSNSDLKCALTKWEINMWDNGEPDWVHISDPKFDKYNMENGVKIKNFPDWCPLEDEEN